LFLHKEDIMTTVKQLLGKKGSDVWTIGPEATVRDALQLMADKGIGALIVIQAGQIQGIFSERDYARKVALKDRQTADTAVREIMSTGVVTITPTQSVRECMALFTEHHFRHLPVVDQGRLAGLISIGDVVGTLLTDQQAHIDQLESYITGG
jgi:CBS domain-containing protein